MSAVSTFLSFDVLRSWPDFVDVEHLVKVGQRITLKVDRFGVEGEFIVGEIGEHGIRFDNAEPAPGGNTA